MRSSRSARARADLDEDSAIYEKGRSGEVLGRGDDVERLLRGWQRYRLAAPPPAQVYMMRHAGVQDAERARWGARGARAARGARGAHSEGPEVWAWRAWIEDARRIPPLTQPGGGAAEGVGCTSACLAWLFVQSPAWVATVQPSIWVPEHVANGAWVELAVTGLIAGCVVMGVIFFVEGSGVYHYDSTMSTMAGAMQFSWG